MNRAASSALKSATPHRGLASLTKSAPKAALKPPKATPAPKVTKAATAGKQPIYDAKTNELTVIQPQCFPAGVPLLTPEGAKNIEDFRPGDLLLSRDEHDPHGPLVVGVVEEVFQRSGETFALTLAGRTFRTTAEHPFYVHDRGWIDAKDLCVGDLLVGHDGRLARPRSVLSRDRAANGLRDAERAN
jgi:hypothetical protein